MLMMLIAGFWKIIIIDFYPECAPKMFWIRDKLVINRCVDPLSPSVCSWSTRWNTYDKLSYVSGLTLYRWGYESKWILSIYIVWKKAATFPTYRKNEGEKCLFLGDGKRWGSHSNLFEFKSLQWTGNPHCLGHIWPSYVFKVLDFSFLKCKHIPPELGNNSVRCKFTSQGLLLAQDLKFLA